MPSAHYSSFDRGFDVGQRSAPKVSRAEHDRSGLLAKPKKSPTNKYVAIALVAIMVASAFAMLAPVGSRKIQAPEDEMPASSEQVGPMESNYVISNIGETYKKSDNYADFGRHTGGLGLSSWWGEEFNPMLPPAGKWDFYRNYYYGDMVIRDKYPIVIGYNPYSDWIPASHKNVLDFTLHSFYRTTSTVTNVSGLGTQIGKDPGVLPILLPGGTDVDGGNAQMWMYGTYLTAQECGDIYDGNHYANTYYDVPAGVVDVEAGYNYYDGWWWEWQGRIQFDRNAAHKFLGLDLTGDLRTLFNTANADNALGDLWNAEWIAEGSEYADGDGTHRDGYVNIYAAYDYELNYGVPYLYLKLDPDTSHSTADSISVLMWSASTGEETIMLRFLDVAGVRHNLGSWPEDWYLNMTLHPEYGDLQERATAVYHMTAWKDDSIFSPSWMLESQHIDYTGDFGDPNEWVSYHNNYFVDYYGGAYNPDKMSYSPGQPSYATRVCYWQTPMDWNLTAGETLTIKLPTDKPGWGITPYWDADGAFGDAKVAQLNSNGMWGEWVLGRGTPAWYYSTDYYDSATKNLTFKGPLLMDKVMNEAQPTYDIFETGSPKVLIDISRVSHYQLTLQGNPSPIHAGQQYWLQVTPLNFTNVATRCNQTVTLPAVSGVSYGEMSHTFLWNETSWNTTIVFGSINTVYNLLSADSIYSLDVFDTYSFTTDNIYIPEFPTLLIPVIGAAAVFVVLRRRKTSM